MATYRTRFKRKLNNSPTSLISTIIRSRNLRICNMNRLWEKAALLVGIYLFLFLVGVGVSRFGGEEDLVWVAPNAQPFNENHEIKHATHLIMVAGHSVIISGHLRDANIDEKDWYLLDYQKGQGLPQAMLSHIRAGINEAAKDPSSLLIFSGGETRAITGPVNEGSSYFRVADALNLWEEPAKTMTLASASSVRARTTAEEFATDSFQNLMFSICRFKEVTGNYPTKITAVSFSFKRRRFEHLHAAAIQWPAHLFNYIGTDPDASTGFDLAKSTEGEYNNAARPFENDMYGCNTDILRQKRENRNPFYRTPPYELTCPEMKTLLNWCGPNLISTEDVPW